MTHAAISGRGGMNPDCQLCPAKTPASCRPKNADVASRAMTIEVVGLSPGLKLECAPVLTRRACLHCVDGQPDCSLLFSRPTTMTHLNQGSPASERAPAFSRTLTHAASAAAIHADDIQSLKVLLVRQKQDSQRLPNGYVEDLKPSLVEQTTGRLTVMSLFPLKRLQRSKDGSPKA